MEYTLYMKAKSGKEFLTLQTKKVDSLNFLSLILACASLYEKIEVKEMNESTYELTMIKRKKMIQLFTWTQRLMIIDVGLIVTLIIKVRLYYG